MVYLLEMGEELTFPKYMAAHILWPNQEGKMEGEGIE